MHTVKGKGVYGGVALGKALCIGVKKETVKRIKTDNIKKELNRINTACEKAKKQLEKLYDDALHEVGEANAEIFNIHHMMIDDADYRESIEKIIENEGVNAEYAAAVTGDNFSSMFSSMEDEYMKERANDVKDITGRIISILSDSDNNYEISEPVIIFAEDLLPSQTVRFDKSKVLAFVTQKGSVNSHTAILARTMNIPAVVGIGGKEKNIDGEEVIVDGFTGTVYINPDDETREKMVQKRDEDTEKKKLLQKLKGEETRTADGRKINLYANIGGLSDLADVMQNDAEGIGLFRSEFLYLDKDTFPTEEEQFLVYKTVAQNMAGKKVIIRTLDIGADKHIGYFNIEKEENPALGYRAIRICLDRTDIFKTQIRALLRASAYGNISILIPMIVSADEILEVKKIIREVSYELKSASIPFEENIELGVMIETPASVIISDKLAKEVDFFSVGTNDLTQYTLAADRQNQRVEYLCEKPDISVLRMIKIAADNAKKEGIWIGICGELGADISLTDYFLSIGIDELSVSAPAVLPLRKKIIETDVEKIRKKALKIVE